MQHNLASHMCDTTIYHLICHELCISTVTMFDIHCLHEYHHIFKYWSHTLISFNMWTAQGQISKTLIWPLSWSALMHLVTNCLGICLRAVTAIGHTLGAGIVGFNCQSVVGLVLLLWLWFSQRVCRPVVAADWIASSCSSTFSKMIERDEHLNASGKPIFHTFLFYNWAHHIQPILLIRPYEYDRITLGDGST